MGAGDGTKIAAWGLLGVSLAGLYGAVTNKSWLSVLRGSVDPSTSPSTIDPGLTASQVAGNASFVSGNHAARAIEFGRRHLGDPYLYGGSGPHHWDCSGLLQAEARAGGFVMPRTAELQKEFTRKWKIAKTTNPPPGAFVFFGTHGFAEHCGLSIGNGNMIEAPHTGDVVKVYSIAAEGDLIMVTDPLGALDARANARGGPTTGKKRVKLPGGQ